MLKGLLIPWEAVQSLGISLLNHAGSFFHKIGLVQGLLWIFVCLLTFQVRLFFSLIWGCLWKAFAFRRLLKDFWCRKNWTSFPLAVRYTGPENAARRGRQVSKGEWGAWGTQTTIVIRLSEEFPNWNIWAFALYVKYHIFPSSRREESIWQWGPFCPSPTLRSMVTLWKRSSPGYVKKNEKCINPAWTFTFQLQTEQPHT